jgi:hypothetical protein
VQPNFFALCGAPEMHQLGAYDDMTAEPLLNHILAAECRTPHRRHRWIRKRFSSEYLYNYEKWCFLRVSRDGAGRPAGRATRRRHAADALAAATHAAHSLPAASPLDRSFKSPTIAVCKNISIHIEPKISKI